MKVNIAKSDVCSFCGKSGHAEELCWTKNPELRHAKCAKCNRYHTGKCSGKSWNPTNEPSTDVVIKTSLIQTSPSIYCKLNFFKPWTVKVEKYSISPIVDSGASCSIMSPSFANELVNKFKDSTDIIELSSPPSVEFGNANKVTAKQSVVLQNALNDQSIEFLVVPTLNVPFLLSETEMARFE